jgi:hypothetical protein
MNRWTFLPTTKTGSLTDQWGDRIAEDVKNDALLEALKGKDSFAVLSAYTQGDRWSDGANHERLGLELRELGFEPTEGIGVWDGVVEQSFVITNLPFSELVKLATKYHQESVVYRGADGVLGLYNRETLKSWPAVDAKGDLFITGDRLLWGPVRPWDGVFPMTKVDVESLPEVSPR